MDHDILAELDGYRTELAQAERTGKTDRAQAIRAEIDRVAAAVRRRAAAGVDDAERYHASGQLELAARARREAGRYSDAAGADDASAQTPLESAVPAKRGSGRTSKEN